MLSKLSLSLSLSLSLQLQQPKPSKFTIFLSETGIAEMQSNKLKWGFDTNVSSGSFEHASLKDSVMSRHAICILVEDMDLTMMKYTKNNFPKILKPLINLHTNSTNLCV